MICRSRVLRARYHGLFVKPIEDSWAALRSVRASRNCVARGKFAAMACVSKTFSDQNYVAGSQGRPPAFALLAIRFGADYRLG